MSTNNTATVLLPLNHAKVVFLHPDDTGLSAPCAVQIDVRVPDRDQVKNIERLYATRGPDISSVLLKLVIVHMQQGLPERFVIEDDDLVILASRSPWVYGRSKFVLTWGEERIPSAEDKWRFNVAMRGSGDE